MMDKAHRLTDRIVEYLDAELSKIYRDARKDIARGLDGLDFTKLRERDKAVGIVIDSIINADASAVDTINSAHLQTYRINFKWAADEMIRQIKGG